MDLALIFSAAMMGLAGAPHCIAMCGAACAAIHGRSRLRLAVFHLGRLISYALAGGVAAASVGTIAGLGKSTATFRPLWTLMHLAALGLGLFLIWRGRQPEWMERLGRGRMADAGDKSPGGWQRISGPGRSAVAGLFWVAWPCGLLQSALLVSALANRPIYGAMAMASFAATSALGLTLGQVLFFRLAGGAPSPSLAGWMVRISGLALVAASSWALGHGVWMRFWAWCTT